MTALIEYGLTTKVLSTGWKADLIPWDELFTPEELELWWRRTDYAVRCSRCPRSAWVMYKTPRGAKRSAEKHATEHPGATVREI